jgi:hypothetical protein
VRRPRSPSTSQSPHLCTWLGHPRGRDTCYECDRLRPSRMNYAVTQPLAFFFCCVTASQPPKKKNFRAFRRECFPVCMHTPLKKNQIGDHALPQRGFGLSTPSGAERKGATPSNTRHRRQRESRQRAAHEPRSGHTRARIETIR